MAPKLTRHDIGHALYKALAEVLDKTSWNVKQQRANITPQQAEGRRAAYAQRLGLKPQKNGKTMGAPPPAGKAAAWVPAATRNTLPYTGDFGVEHETAHAMMTPEGSTLRQYQNHLTQHSAPQGPSAGEDPDFYDPIHDEAAHIEAVGHENTANRIEYGIDRRAGVDPHKFKSKYRDDIVQPIDAGDYFDPSDRSADTEEAQHYHQKFDEGARFNHLGRIAPPSGPDAKINARARLPGAHLFKQQDTFHKAEPNLTPQESLVADEKKALSIPQALHELHKGLTERVKEFEQDCLTLRKAELAKKSPPGRKEEVEKLKAKGLPASEAFGIAWKQHNALDKSLEEGTQGVAGMAMAEGAACKACGEPLAKCSCGRAERYAKGEPDMQMSEDDKIEKWAKSELTKTLNPVIAARMAANKAKARAAAAPPSAPAAAPEGAKKGEMPAGAAPEYPGKKIGVLPDDKKEREQGGDEGSGGDIKKTSLALTKAGFRPGSPSPMGGSAPPAAMPPRPKLPGMGKPAAGGLPKPPSPAGGMKPPAMGAGAPAMKAELTKAGPPPIPAAAHKPAVISSAPNPMHQPGGMVGMSVKGTMGLPAGHGAVSGGLPKPAAGVKTMVERVASRMPQAGGSKLPGAHLFGKAEGDPSLAKEHVGFNKLAGDLAHEKGVDDPKAVAAALGRKKYGAAGMAHKAAQGKK